MFARPSRPLVFALLALPLLGVAMAAFGAASLVGMMHLPKWTAADEAGSRVVSIQVQDGATMRAAWTVPANGSGRCVLVLHGVGGARSSSQRYTAPLVASGYATLAPDSRAHGESGGDLVTYGLLERYDAAAWARWMRAQGCRRVFGHGESLGASVLLMANALDGGPLFEAIVADCPFADLIDTAEYRAQQLFPVPNAVAGAIAKLAVGAGGAYSKWMYDLDFAQASAEKAIAARATPVLLIHGAADNRTPPEQSQRLAAANPQVTELWLVEGARHVGSFRAARDQYLRRMSAWFGEVQ